MMRSDRTLDILWPTRFADRLDVECESKRGDQEMIRIFFFPEQLKNAAAINWDGDKCSQCEGSGLGGASGTQFQTKKTVGMQRPMPLSIVSLQLFSFKAQVGSQFWEMQLLDFRGFPHHIFNQSISCLSRIICYVCVCVCVRIHIFVLAINLFIVDYVFGWPSLWILCNYVPSHKNRAFCFQNHD